MIRLAMRTLRFRVSGFLATFLAVLFGAAVVMACAGVLQTGVLADAPAQRLAGTQIVVSGDSRYELPSAPDRTAAVDAESEEESEEEDEEDPVVAILPEKNRIDAGLAASIARIPGVTGARADLSFPTTVQHNGEVVTETAAGHGWASAALTPYTMASGKPPQAPGDVVLDEVAVAEGDLDVGDRVQIGTGGASAGYRLTGIATAAEGREITERSVFFTDARAEQLAGHPGEVDAIGVSTVDSQTATVAERIASAIDDPSVQVLAGAERGLAEFPEVLASAENLIIVGAVSGSMALLVALFVVSSTVALSVRQRHREIALLRGIGTTPGQIRWMVLAETLIVAVAGVAAAILPGLLLGHGLFALMRGAVVPEAVEFHMGPVTLTIGAGAMLIASAAAALMSSRRAASTRPIEALVEASVSGRWLTRSRLLFAVVFLAGGLALGVVTVTVMSGPLAQSTAGPAVITWAVGIALLSPGLTRLLAGVLRRPARAIFGVPGYLATRNVDATLPRVAAAVTPIMLATAVATGNLYLQTTAASATEAGYTEHLRADAVVSSANGALDSDLVDRLDRLPGVAGASAFVTSTGFIAEPYDDYQNEDGTTLQGLSEGAVQQVSAAPVTAGSLADLRGETVALPAEHAAEIGRGLGDTLTLRLGDNTSATVRVVALFQADPGFETILLPAPLLAPHTTTGQPSQILVRAAPTGNAEELIESVSTATGRLSGVQVGDADDIGISYRAGTETQAFVNYLMIGAILGYTALSVVNTLVMATLNRRREFGLQRLTGCSRRQVLTMMTAEGGIVACIGILLGTVASLISLVPFSISVSGTPVPSGPLWMYLGVVLVAGGLSFAATLLPTRRALLATPAEAAKVGE